MSKPVKQRLRRYVNGELELCYAKDAKGITHSFSSNRAQRRAEEAHWRKKEGERGQRKREARKQFELVRKASNARAKQLKADRNAQRAKQAELWQLQQEWERSV